MLQLLLSIYLESWYQNEYLPNSTSGSTDAYAPLDDLQCHWTNLPDKERAVDDARCRISECSFGTYRPKKWKYGTLRHTVSACFIKDSFEPDTGDYELFFQLKNIPCWKKIRFFIQRNSLPAFIRRKERQHLPLSQGYALALYCGLKPGEILGLKYDSFNLEAEYGNDLRVRMHGTICPLTGMELTVARTSNTVAENSVFRQQLPYCACSGIFIWWDQGPEDIWMRALFWNILDWPERAPCALVHMEKSRRFPLNTRLKKITQSYGLPRISLGDLRYVSRRSYQKGKTV